MQQRCRLGGGCGRTGWTLRDVSLLFWPHALRVSWDAHVVEDRVLRGSGSQRRIVLHLLEHLVGHPLRQSATLLLAHVLFRYVRHQSTVRLGLRRRRKRKAQSSFGAPPQAPLLLAKTGLGEQRPYVCLCRLLASSSLILTRLAPSIGAGSLRHLLPHPPPLPV